MVFALKGATLVRDVDDDGSPICELLSWDSEFFGFPVARTTLDRPDGSAVLRIVEWCVERGIRCLYHSADPDWPQGLAAVSSAGFQLLDIRHEMRYVPDAAAEPPCQDRFVVRGARESDRGELVQLAQSSFTSTRFFRDEGFPRDRVGVLYGTWLERALNEGLVFVVSSNGEADGFVACESGPDGLRIVLLAVAEESRGQSMGDSLVRHVIRWACDHGSPPISVVTQGSNVRALRTYEGSDFRTHRVSFWYHRWF